MTLGRNDRDIEEITQRLKMPYTAWNHSHRLLFYYLLTKRYQYSCLLVYIFFLIPKTNDSTLKNNKNNLAVLQGSRSFYSLRKKMVLVEHLINNSWAASDREVYY